MTGTSRISHSEFYFCAAPVGGQWEQIPEEVVVLFETFAMRAIDAGQERYSSDAILHRIRWYRHIERGEREFKCNDNWTPYLARWFHYRHPEHLGFFELRALKAIPNEHL